MPPSAETYPGSKKLRRPPPEPKELPPLPEIAWDEQPHYVLYKGQTIEVFWRGALAKALNRTVVAIRAMERKGSIRTPALFDKHERWLYTRDQIEDMVKLAKEEGVLDPRTTRKFSDRFVKEAHRILGRRPS